MPKEDCQQGSSDWRTRMSTSKPFNFQTNAVLTALAHVIQARFGVKWWPQASALTSMELFTVHWIPNWLWMLESWKSEQI